MRRKWSRLETFISWLRGFLPVAVTIDRNERMRACCGMLIGILITGLATRLMLGSSVNVPLLMAPIGASAVLLFAVPSSPLAQPWSIVGGNIISAVIGVACARLVGEPMMAAAVAGAAAIGAMFVLRCLHPPSGAVALTAVLGGPAILAQGYAFVLFPVAINSILLMLRWHSIMQPAAAIRMRCRPTMATRTARPTCGPSIAWDSNPKIWTKY